MITGINGRALDSPAALAEVMRKLAVGASVRLNVYREGQRREVVYTLPERPLLPSDVSEGRTLSPAGGRARAPGSTDPAGPRPGDGA